MPKLVWPLLLILVSQAQSLRAQTDCDTSNEDCRELGSWQFSLGVGAGLRTNPLVDGSDIPLLLIPQVSYSGEHFFIQNLDMGLILFEDKYQQLNLFITPSYDQVFFQRWNPRNFFVESNNLTGARENFILDEKLPNIDIPLDGKTPSIQAPDSITLQTKPNSSHKRRTAGLAGIEYNLSWAELELQLHYVSDVTGVHKGDEARVSLAKNWRLERQNLSLGLGAIWQSEEVVNYYYGSSDPLLSYSARAGLTKLVRVDWSYELSERWDLHLLASYRFLPQTISASPWVQDNKVITAFVGGVYHF
jgi:MipA family protein